MSPLSDRLAVTWSMAECSRGRATVGITACPYDERLYRLGMGAAAARGAAGGARNLLNALRTVLHEQIEPDDEIVPETLEEYGRAARDASAPSDNGCRS
jgi:hypothetical protein